MEVYKGIDVSAGDACVPSSSELLREIRRHRTLCLGQYPARLSAGSILGSKILHDYPRTRMNLQAADSKKFKSGSLALGLSYRLGATLSACLPRLRFRLE